jgi:hypothetical protein
MNKFLLVESSVPLASDLYFNEREAVPPEATSDKDIVERETEVVQYHRRHYRPLKLR